MRAQKRKAHTALWRRAFSFLFPALAVGLILWLEPLGYALFLLAAVLLHETGHFVAFLALGEPLPSLSGRAGGLLFTPKGELLSYKRELLIAAAGPLFNLLGCAALLPALQNGVEHEASFCFFALNLLSALFNLLPIAGFDGGRVLFCALSLLLPARAARVCSDLVSVTAVLFFYFSALFLFLFTDGGGYSFLLALFLLAEEGRRTGVIFLRFGRFSEKTRAFVRKREI